MLTDAEHRAYAFVTSFYEDHGYMPSTKQLAFHMDNERSVVAKLCHALVDKNRLCHVAPPMSFVLASSLTEKESHALSPPASLAEYLARLR